MFDFTTWDNDNILALTTIAIAAIGGILVYLQWHKSVKLRPVKFPNQIIERIRFNEEMSKSL
jgi:hypothetical protein